MKKIDPQRFEDWLVNKQLADVTVQNYMYYFFKFSKDHILLNQESAVRFYSEKNNRNSIGKTFLVNYRKFLMENYRALGITVEELGDLAEMDLSSFKIGKNVALVKPIPHDDIFIIEKHLNSERLKIQLMLTYNCGLRLGEALKVRFRSFNWDEWSKDMTKYGECRVLGKGSKPGIALVPGHLMNRISKFFGSSSFNPLTENSLLFIKDNIPDEHINVKSKASNWQKHLTHAGIESGITKLDENGKIIDDTRVHPHRLRHSYGTYLLNVKKMNLRQVQELLRHTSITSTQIYTHIDKEDLKEELNK